MLLPLVGPVVSGTVQGFITWKQGEAHKYYEYDSDIVYRAAMRASTEDMNMVVMNDKSKNDDYHFTANNFKISIEQIDKNISKLSVRINFMGDKDYAELFYQKVDEQIPVIDFK